MLEKISSADLSDPWAEIQQLRHEQALDFQWQLLVELTGSEACAATVVGQTPFMGVPRRAAEILEARSA